MQLTLINLNNFSQEKSFHTPVLRSGRLEKSSSNQVFKGLNSVNNNYHILYGWNEEGESSFLGNVGHQSPRFLGDKIITFGEGKIFLFDPKTQTTEENLLSIDGKIITPELNNISLHVGDSKDFFVLTGNLYNIKLTPFVAIMDRKNLTCIDYHFFEELEKVYFQRLVVSNGWMFMFFKAASEAEGNSLWAFRTSTKEKTLLKLNEDEWLNTLTSLSVKGNLLIAEYQIRENYNSHNYESLINIWQIPSLKLIFNQSFPNLTKTKYTQGCLLTVNDNILTKMDFKVTEESEDQVKPQ